MLRRKIQSIIRQNFESEEAEVLLIDGARQVGKSYIIREEGKRHFSNFVEIDMAEDARGQRIFANVSSTEDFYLRLSSVAGDRLKGRNDTLVFIDEIQKYPHLLSLLKPLRDEGRFTYVASGSLLGVTLFNAPSVPGGRIRIERMFPLDFEEFLWALGVGEDAIVHLEESFRKRESLDEGLHSYFLSLFKRYLLVGGLPAAVNAYLGSHNIVDVRSVHRDIHSLYLTDASRYDSEKSLKIRRIYELLPSFMENRHKRVVFKDIEGRKGDRADRYRDEFEYLVASGIAIPVGAISNPRFPLKLSVRKNLLKLYMNDPGLLSYLLYGHNVAAVLDDSLGVNLGSLYETAAACELASHGFEMYYYDNSSKGEVDFLYDDYDSLSAVPVEVKSGRDYSVHRALDRFVSNAECGVRKAYVISNERELCRDGLLEYIPVYDMMFVRPSLTSGTEF